jgi:polar amino acid transport system permease protein
MDQQGLIQMILEPQYLAWLWHGFLVTLAISGLSMITSTLLGLLLAAGRDGGLKPLNILVIGYCAIFRNTPLLVQLFFWYFAVGKFLPEDWMPWLNSVHQVALFGAVIHWPSFEFLSAFVGLTLYFSAFIAEELRAGLRGVAREQKYAAAALGLTGWQSMRYVVLPQAFQIVFSPLLGQYMNIVKSSSLAMAIGVAELSYAARQVETASLKAFQAFAVATLLYIIVIALIETFGLWHERRTIAKMGR